MLNAPFMINFKMEDLIFGEWISTQQNWIYSKENFQTNKEFLEFYINVGFQMPIWMIWKQRLSKQRDKLTKIGNINYGLSRI